MAKNQTIPCTCCGTECARPQWFKGKPYGYTCITKVAPDQKRVKDDGLWIKVDSVEVKINGRPTTAAKVRIDDVSFWVEVRVDIDGNILSARNLQGEYLRISRYKNGTEPTCKCIDIEQERDGKGNLYPVRAVFHSRQRSVTIAEFSK